MITTHLLHASVFCVSPSKLWESNNYSDLHKGMSHYLILKSLWLAIDNVRNNTQISKHKPKVY